VKYRTLAQKIIELKNVDLALRDRLIEKEELGIGYNQEMEKVHNRNAEELNKIMKKIGYPTIDKVGKEASEAAWLIIQHAIGKPNFMKKSLGLLIEAVENNKASKINMAYLSDRIAVFQGKSQLYGTQFDWDKNGLLSPQKFDDLQKVNQRRKSIGLNTLGEQRIIIRAQAKVEMQSPPKDFEKRKVAMEAWAKKVGWKN